MQSIFFSALIFLYCSVGVVYATSDVRQIGSINVHKKSPSREKPTSEEYFPQFCFLEFRGAYFLSTTHSLRESYAPAALCGLEFSCHLYKKLYAWIGASYLNREGKSRPTGTDTALVIVPVNVGMKWIYNIYRIQPYLGIGAEATYGHEKVRNPPATSMFVHSRSNWAWGGIFKIGFLIYFVEHFFLDFYADYSLRTLNLKKISSSAPHLEFVNSVDLSGFSFGAGLGCGF